jgi:hypothetical protein
MIYFFNIIGMAMLVASVLSMAVIHAISPIDRPYRVHLVATVFSSSTAPIDTSSYAPTPTRFGGTTRLRKQAAVRDSRP